MSNLLDGKKIAFLATDGFEEVELTQPRQAADDAGAETELVSLDEDAIQGMNHLEKAARHDVDVTVDAADWDSYDGLVLPGGLANPDELRQNAAAVEAVQHFMRAGKPVAAICHAPWTLIEADAVRGRTLTSWPSLQTDVRNAGGNWIDAEVHVDNGLVTSRKPDDLDAFCAKMVEEMAEGRHKRESVQTA